jgi:hypothetical protein
MSVSVWCVCGVCVGVCLCGSVCMCVEYVYVCVFVWGVCVSVSV